MATSIRQTKQRVSNTFSKDIENAALLPHEMTLAVEDGNAQFHYKCSRFQITSGNLFSMMVKDTDVIFSTDLYQPNSLKSVRRNLSFQEK